jgi:hypothetical protein
MIAPFCRTFNRGLIKEARRRNLPVWAFLLLIEVPRADA